MDVSKSEAGVDRPGPDVRPLLRRRRLVVAAVLAVGLAAAPGIARLELDNSPEGFFVDHASELARYRRFEAELGRDRAVRVAVSGPALWSRDGLAWLGELEERLEDLPGVLAAGGLYRHHAGGPEGWPPADPEAFRDRVTSDAVDRGAGWVAADGSVATVLVALPRRDPAAALAAIETLATAAPPGIATAVVGLPVVERALDREVADMALRFAPVLSLLIVAILAALVRRLLQVGAVVALIALAEVTTLGAMGWAGARLDVVTALLVPLVAVVATATAVHLLLRFRLLRGRGLDAPTAARELVRQKAWPVVWAGLTTAAGFGSLAVARVPAVRELGAWAAFGFVWTTLAALTLVPCLLAGEGDRRVPARRGWTASAHRLGRRWAAAAIARRGVVYAAFALGALAAATGALRLRVESDPLAFLALDHPARVGLAALERAGLGAAAAELVLELPRGAEGSFEDAERLERLADLAARLRGHPSAWGVVSAGDVVAGRRRPDEGRGADAWRRARERVRATPEGDRMLSFLVSPDGRRARVSVMVPMAGADELEDLFTAAGAQAAAVFPEAEHFLTGRYPLVLRAQRTLLDTMLLSLSVAVVLVAAALWLLLGGAGLAVRALVPNLWPVLVALGVMGWAGVPLDSSTVAVAAVAFGLVVDDTLHTFADFRRQASRRGSRRAVVAALGRNAPAHLVTAVLLAGGLALVGLSDLVAAARFGVLTAVAVAAALAADLLLVPPLLAGAAPPRRPGRLRPVAAPGGASRRPRRGGRGRGGSAPRR